MILLTANMVTPYKQEIVFVPGVVFLQDPQLSLMMMLANNIYVIKPTHCTLLLQRKIKSVDLNKHSGEQQV